MLLLLFIIISNFIILDSRYYPGHYHHQSHVEPSVPPVHVSGYMPQRHQSHAQSIYQSTSFSGYMPQGCMNKVFKHEDSHYICLNTHFKFILSQMFFKDSHKGLVSLSTLRHLHTTHHHWALVIVYHYLLRCMTYIMRMRKKMIITIIPTIMMMTMMMVMVVMMFSTITKSYICIYCWGTTTNKSRSFCILKVMSKKIQKKKTGPIEVMFKKIKIKVVNFFKTLMKKKS